MWRAIRGKTHALKYDDHATFTDTNLAAVFPPLCLYGAVISKEGLGVSNFFSKDDNAYPLDTGACASAGEFMTGAQWNASSSHNMAV